MASNNLPPFPTLGVKLKVFLKFVDDNGGRNAFLNRPILKEPLTTTDVCNKFLKPITSPKSQSYCELLAEQNSPDVGEASHFISHAWKYSFMDVVDALQHHFSHEPDVYLWFDLFSNNQHSAPNLPFEWWKDTFMNAIGKLDRVVMILSPWNNPIPLTRAWCLWEIYCAVHCSRVFEIAITPVQQDAFVKGITSDPGEFYEMLGNINVERSEAFKVEDKERIFDVVKSTVGFAKLNEIVIGKMREWVVTAIDGNIQQSELAIENARISGVGIDEARLTIWGNMLAKMSLLNDMGLYAEAGEIGEQCLVDFNDLENETNWSKTLHNVGDVYDSQGQYDKAIEYYEKSLVIRLKAFGPDHPDVGASYNNLGVAYDSQGQYDKAVEYYKKSLVIRLKAFGSDHSIVSQSYNNLGNVYDSQGQYDKAIEHFEMSLVIRLKAFGPEHPDVGASYNNLGSVYYRQGQYDKAIEYYEKSLVIYLKALGVYHPDVGASYNNLGNVYNFQCQYNKAIEHYEKCLVIYLKALGPDHPDVGQSYSNLGNVYNYQDQYDKAIEYYEKSLVIRLKAFGSDHPDVGASYNNLGSVYNFQGQYDKAIEHFNKCLMIRLNALGVDHPDVGQSYNNLGFVFYSQGKYDKAMEYYEKCLMIRSKALGPDHPDTNAVQNNIAVCQRASSRVCIVS
jgi:tetratricopeptide (TPR) repeat protein